MVGVHDFCIALCFSLYQRIFVGEDLAKDPEWVYPFLVPLD